MKQYWKNSLTPVARIAQCSAYTVLSNYLVCTVSFRKCAEFIRNNILIPYINNTEMALFFHPEGILN